MFIDSEHDQFDSDEDDDLVDDEYVPGVAGLLLKQVDPRLYPINIYQIDGQKQSGIAGTLYPDGQFVPLPRTGVQLTLERTGHRPETWWWDERTAKFAGGELVWDSTIHGSIELSPVGGPHKRMWDGSITGPWPTNPPRASRPVSPEKAREAARELQETEQWS